ncbi:MAG: SGNH/GDSL hydrolase family protein [Chthoniobacteraceae bacterium]
MKRILLILLAIVCTALAQKPAARKPDPAMAPITDEAGLPRVLLIGDSISIGYTLPTRELLKGKANVHRIPANGGSTKDGLARIDAWLGTGKWDLIHFNWGLHDLKHWKDKKLDMTGPQVSTLEDYEKNLRELVKRLKSTGPKLIFATTTPVPEGSGGRVAGDDLKYNAVAVRVMKEQGIPINDLNAFCAPKLPELQLPKNVHFKPEGSRALAEQVAREIESALRK